MLRAQRERYRSDEAYREAKRRRSREAHWRATADPVRREQRNARQRERYREDPEYAARKRATARATYHRTR